MDDVYEQRLARVFVELADTLVDDFDMLDFLSMLTERCADLLNIAAAGVVLADQRGGLRMAAASTEKARLVELFAVQADDGPCLDCVRTGTSVAGPNLAAADKRWPQFAPAARAAGFLAAHAVPMRLRGRVVGALNLLDDKASGVDTMTVELAQALADVATIGLLQQQTIDETAVLAEQLQAALSSRVVIEQAKGVLSARGGLSMEQAFTALRGYARAQQKGLSEVARSVADGAADLDGILGHSGDSQ